MIGRGTGRGIGNLTVYENEEAARQDGTFPAVKPLDGERSIATLKGNLEIKTIEGGGSGGREVGPEIVEDEENPPLPETPGKKTVPVYIPPIKNDMWPVTDNKLIQACRVVAMSAFLMQNVPNGMESFTYEELVMVSKKALPSEVVTKEYYGRAFMHWLSKGLFKNSYSTTNAYTLAKQYRTPELNNGYE